MILSRREISTADVAGHYDQLDRFYREIWGEHLHHGLWAQGCETPQQAVVELMRRVASPLRIDPGAAICDVGCGYGGTARYLAREYDARATGLTISRAQFDFAVAHNADADNPTFLLQNWEENQLDDEAFDGLVSIECLAHVPDKKTFFRQVRRVLRPGGRASITAWLAGDDAKRWHQRYLLEPICREGRCPSIGTRTDYCDLLESQGLRLVAYDDLSQQVRRTWRVCSRRLSWKLCTRPDYWRFLLTGQSRHAVFLLTLYRIRLAYRTGAMRYGHFVVEKS